MNNIEIKNISFTYNRKDILKNLSLRFDSKGITSICGSNGVGKTTLLRLIAGFIQPSEGSINRPEKFTIGYIFQNPVFLNRTVNENLLHAILSVNKSINKDTARTKIHSALDRFSLKYTKNISINKLSGGQQQIIAIIRSLIVNPDVILCDEPTSNLDAANKELIEEILLDNSKYRKIILVTQDKEQATRISNQIYTLKYDKLSKKY